MPNAQRIEPKEAKQHMESKDALLVCAYDSKDKFRENHLNEAIALHEFGARAEDIDKDREVIFY